MRERLLLENAPPPGPDAAVLLGHVDLTDTVSTPQDVQERIREMMNMAAR